MKYAITTLLLLFWVGASFAQVNLEPKAIPAPNSASLGEYGAVPVGHYTGIPDVNIPLYELELDGVKFPLSLSYHASGVKVAQEASWVGMGWSLNAGGCIMRSVQGWDDFGTTPMGYFWNSNPPLATASNDIKQIASASERQKYEEMQNNRVDPEPDIFYFNFAGHAGKFFVQRSSESGNSRPKAIVQTPDCYLDMVYDLNKWIVTDGDGFKYYFGTKEVSRVRSIQSNSQCNSYSYYLKNKNLAATHEPQTDITTAWYLDSIVSPNRQKLAFAYAIEETVTPMGMQESAFGLLEVIQGDSYIGTPQKQVYASYSYSTNKQPVLKKITGNNLTIDFTGEARADVEPRYAAQKPTRLAKVSVRNNSSLVKEFRLGYFYTGTQNNYDNCRLFLNTVQEVGTDGSLGGCYTLGYDNGVLPAKTSTDVDHWGYYTTPSTGMASNCWGTEVVRDNTYSTLIPPVTVTIGNTVKAFYGHNRNSNAAKMGYGILKSIKYPTGGQTSFTYEPCTTSSSSVLPPTVVEHSYEENFEDFYFSDLPMDNQDDFPTGSRVGTPFQISTRTAGTFRLSIDYITGGDFTNETLHPDDRYTAALKRLNTSTGRYEMVKNVYFPHLSESNGVVTRDYELMLEAGTYRIDMDRSYTFNALQYHEGSLEVFGSASCVVFTESGGGSSTETTITGGLRIRQIETTDLNGNVAKKTYEYADAVLMSPLVYHYAVPIARTEVQVLSNGDKIVHHTLSNYMCGMSSSYVPMSTAAMGSYVGYGRVTETVWNGSSKTGSTTYDFYNECDELIDISDRFIPGFPSKPALNNGLPKQTIHYNASGNAVCKEVYNYEFAKGTSIKGVKLYQPAMDTDNLYIKFYDMDSSWNKLLSKTISEYTLTGSLIVQTTESYVYEPSNYKVKEVKIAGSRSGITYRKVLEYPANLKSSATAYQQMVNSQILNPVVEEKNYVVQGSSQTLMDTKRTMYGTFDGKILPSSILQNKTKGSSALEERMRTTHYDKNGKPNDYVKGGLEKVVYLWGYNSMYPVAKIEGATYSEVEGWLGTAVINNLAGNTATVDTALNTIRNTLSGKGVLVTTYTYTPLVGMTSMTAPNGEKTTYEYDSQGRLAKVKDHNLKVVEQYDYHYKN